MPQLYLDWFCGGLKARSWILSCEDGIETLRPHHFHMKVFRRSPLRYISFIYFLNSSINTLPLTFIIHKKFFHFVTALSWFVLLFTSHCLIAQQIIEFYRTSTVKLLNKIVKYGTLQYKSR
jgi:hypothetical protein